MSCKAAVKGNHRLSLPEVDALMTELLTLEIRFAVRMEGRPSFHVKIRNREKFKRIVS